MRKIPKKIFKKNLVLKFLDLNPLESGQLVPKSEVARASGIAGGEEADGAKPVLDHADNDVEKAQISVGK